MVLCHTLQEIRAWVRQERLLGREIAFVPTMGALHAGHMSLVQAARESGASVVVSIFVNPTQFGPSEDLDTYPRRLEADAKLCESEGVGAIFAPSASEMYPEKIQTWVIPTETENLYCGAFRPGHFRGVLTVVAKLFLAVLPDRAYFGQKDYQQLALIRRMVQDLNFPVEIHGCSTHRHEDGLAMSSRNEYLSPAERQKAVAIWCGFEAVRALRALGEQSVDALIAVLRAELENVGFDPIQYIVIADRSTLMPLELVDRPAVVLVAAYMGSTRLIDNLEL
jgi:pantoate--beta-alanine ligase